MNFKQFEAFQAIMTTGSTIGAAARTGLSQSAVSRLLGQLEESLGLPLFIRKKGRLLATPDAEELLAQITTVVDGVQKIQRLADELRIGGARKTLLKVGVPNSMAQQLMPRIVASFVAHHENMVIEIITGPYETIERAVLERSVDLGFVRLPTQLADFDVEPVLRAQGVCVMPIGHPLSEHEYVTVEDLRDVPLVLLGRQRPLRTELDLIFRAANLVPQIRVEVHSAGAACEFVAEGLGVSIINSLLASHFRHLPIVIRPFRPTLSYEFGLVFRSDQPRSRTVSAFAEHLARHLRERNKSVGQIA